MYFTNKDRKIQTQQGIIQRLEEENKCLREQLEACENKGIGHKMELAGQAYREYTGLIEELNELKQEYVELIKEMVEMKEEMKKRCRP